MCASVNRVLKDDGVFIQISFAQPHFRTRYLKNFPDEEKEQLGGAREEAGWAKWNVSHRSFGAAGCLESYLYVCRKKEGGQQELN
jgi:hypothetical protein